VKNIQNYNWGSFDNTRQDFSRNPFWKSFDHFKISEVLFWADFRSAVGGYATEWVRERADRQNSSCDRGPLIVQHSLAFSRTNFTQQLKSPHKLVIRTIFNSDGFNHIQTGWLMLWFPSALHIIIEYHLNDNKGTYPVFLTLGVMAKIWLKMNSVLI